MLQTRRSVRTVGHTWKNIPQLLLTGTFDFLHVTEVLFDGRTVSHAFQNHGHRPTCFSVSMVLWRIYDILEIPDANLSRHRLIGGPGDDTLRIDGSGIQVDLRAKAHHFVRNIEQIDLRGSGDNTLQLDYRGVRQLSSGTLIVRRDPGDAGEFGSGWTQQSDGIILANGLKFLLRSPPF